MTELTVAEPVLTAEFDRLSDVMGVINRYIDQARHGIFFCGNSVGDIMRPIYKEKDIEVDICFEYEYFEVFGLTEEEQKRLENFYCAINKRWSRFRHFMKGLGI